MENLKKYKNAFVETFEVDASELGENFTFEKIDKWDSLRHMALISKLEEEFDVLYDTMDILEYESYENGIKILEKYGISFS